MLAHWHTVCDCSYKGAPIGGNLEVRIFAKVKVSVRTCVRIEKGAECMAPFDFIGDEPYFGGVVASINNGPAVLTH